MVFLPEACDYIADSSKESVALAESLDGHFVSECRQAAQLHGVWLSLGGIHRKVENNYITRIIWYWSHVWST